MILQVVILLSIIYIIHNTYSKYRKLDRNELKGPTPIPILGNLHQLTGELLHRDLTKLSETYGDVFRVWLSDLYTVVLSDPKVIREIYVENIENFIDRPRIPSIEYGTNFKGTVSSMGDDWRKNRDIVSRAMRKTNLKHIYEVIDLQIDILLESMSRVEKTSEPFDQRYFINKFTMSAMFKYIFNDDIPIDDVDDELGKLMKPMEQVFKDFGTGSLFDVLEITRPLYLIWLKLTDKTYGSIMGFIKVKYDNHVKSFNPEIQRDLLDTLISEYKDDEKSILTTVLDFFLAGVDTSSTSLEYMVMMLTNYPEIQEKAYQEIKSVMDNKNNNSKVLLSDRQSMPYIVAIIKETLRFKMVTPFGLPRSTLQDITISDKYFIPKGAQILINYHALSMNEEYYDNPQEYNPSRFLTNESNPAFMPFSIGLRNCVGFSFALDEMFLCLSNMLLNYKFNLINGKKIDEQEGYGLTLRCKNQFKVLLEKRNK